jgi:hypothetical protein
MLLVIASDPVKYFTEYQLYWETQHEGEPLDPKGLQLLKIIMVENLLAANFWKELLELFLAALLYLIMGPKSLKSSFFTYWFNEAH